MTRISTKTVCFQNCLIRFEYDIAGGMFFVTFILCLVAAFDFWKVTMTIAAFEMKSYDITIL